MAHGSPTNPNPTDALEFEITDFASARAAHDSLPPGVDRVPELMTPKYWDVRRRQALPTDRALSGVAIDWLIALPPSLRPRNLCDRYPRVGNALAAAWADASARSALLDGLLTDRRGGRAGFPPAVQVEIQALRKG